MSSLSNKVMHFKNHKVLGIDASTNSLAFCLMDHGAPSSWGEVQYSSSKNLFERLGSIEHRSNIVADYYSDVDFVMIEAPVKIRSTRVAISLAYSYGIVAAKFAAKGIRVNDCSPVTWQRFIGNPPFSAAEKKELKEDYPGHIPSWYTNQVRKVRKQRTIDWVKNEYGILVKSDNVSDAIGVATYAYLRGCRI